MKKKSQLALKLKGFTSSVTLLGAAKFEVGGFMQMPDLVLIKNVY
jgi:hypothetical protein